MQKLSDVLDPITTEGIFHTLYTLDSTIEWLSADIVDYLDNEYYLSHSSQKYISRLYQNLLDKESDGDITSALTTIGQMILNKFISNWNNIYSAYTTEYSPLENYSMVESENVNSSITTTASNSVGMYGFNSTESTPAGENSATSTTSGSSDDNVRELTRSGNIGVTTSQQMLESELKLRKYKFYDHVMNDIDSIMCLMSY